MEALFSRLFRYRQSEGRTPKEDYLTEILAAWLNRMPPEVRLDFVASTFVPTRLRDAFLSIARSSELTVGTQAPLPGGRSLDLLVSHRGLSMIAVESKLTARFQAHPRVVPDLRIEEREPLHDHQLETYGRWLRDAPKPAGWPGVISLLTHATPPPEGFEAWDDARLGAVPHLTWWRRLHAAARVLVGEVGPSDEVPAWRLLGHELVRYLEVEGMASSDFSATDVAALAVAMAPARDAMAMFDEVAADLPRRVPGEVLARRKGSETAAADGRVWGWNYVEGEGDVYVAYGFYFPPFVGHMAALDGRVPPNGDAFVAVGSDKRPALRALPVELGEWRGVAEDWMFVRPVPLGGRMPGERMPEFLVRSVVDRIVEIRTLVALFRGGG